MKYLEHEELKDGEAYVLMDYCSHISTGEYRKDSDDFAIMIEDAENDYQHRLRELHVLSWGEVRYVLDELFNFKAKLRGDKKW